MRFRFWAPLWIAGWLGAPALAAHKSSVDVRPGHRRSALINAAGTAPTCAAGFPCHMLYYGGHVIPNAKVYVVNWTAGVSAGGDLGSFYDAVTNSTYLDWLNEYSTNITTTAPSSVSSVPPGSPGTNQFIGRGVYAGTFTIAPSAANAGGTCPAGAPSGDTCLTDKQIEGELDLQIKNGKLPAADASSLYMTYFPPKYFITDSGGSGSCTGGGFCGYHSTSHGTVSGHEFYYGVLPDHGLGSGCDTGCGLACASGDTACYFDNLTSTSGHELCEAITDAEVGFNTDAATAWYDPGDNNSHQNGEIGDMCNDSTLVAGFNVQNVFSNLVAASDPSHACVVSRVAADDFSVSLPSNKKKIAGGASIQVSIATTTTSGSPGALALSFSGLPAHVSGSLDHSSVPSGTGAVLTLTADSGAVAVKDVVVQIKAAAGAVHTAGLLLDVVPGAADDFTISIAPPAGGTTIAPGSSAQYTVNTSAIGTFTQTIALSLGALPSGVTGSFNPASVTPGQASTLTLTAGAGTATTASTSFTVTGTAGSTSHGASSVVAVGTGNSTGNDFTIALTPPAEIDIAPGASADYSVDTTIAAGSEENVALTLSALPAGLHASFAPATVASGAGSTLTISVDPGTPNQAAVSFTVTGTAASGLHTASANVGVLGPNTFALSIAQSSGSVAAGGHVNYTVTSAVTSGDSSEAISLSLSGLPPGVTGVFAPSVIHAGDSSTLTLTADSSTTPGGPFGFEVDGNALSDFEYAVSDLAVTGADFSLTLSPASATVAPGGSASFTVGAAAVAGAPADIALTIVGSLPAGVTASFSPATVQPAGSSTLTLAAASSAASASAVPFTVRGTDSDGVSHTASAQLAVGTGVVGTGSGPSVAVTHPADGDTVSGAVEIDAAAAPGTGATLVKVELQVDGAVVASPTSSPAQGFWQSADVADGPHVIKARAVDSTGASTFSAPVTVTVDNAAAPLALRGGGGCASSGAGLSALLGLLLLRRSRRHSRNEVIER